MGLPRAKFTSSGSGAVTQPSLWEEEEEEEGNERGWYLRGKGCEDLHFGLPESTRQPWLRSRGPFSQGLAVSRLAGKQSAGPVQEGIGLPSSAPGPCSLLLPPSPCQGPGLGGSSIFPVCMAPGWVGGRQALSLRWGASVCQQGAGPSSPGDFWGRLLVPRAAGGSSSPAQQTARGAWGDPRRAGADASP